MGTVTSSPGSNALAVLTAPSGPLYNSSTLVPQSVLDTASPADLSNLSTEASALSEANLLYGGATSDLFQSTDSFQSYNATLSLLDASYGLTPASSAPTDLLQEGLANLYGTGTTSSASTPATPPSLDQSLASQFADSTSTSGNLVNTTA